MTNSIEKINDKTYQISENGNNLGTITTYQNSFHNEYLYLRFNLNHFPSFSPFPEIIKIENKPLQVMIDSTEKELISFLTKNSFQLKRRCYSPKVSQRLLKNDLPDHPVKITKFTSDDSIYEKCCEFLYDYYKKVHEAVSPLTAHKEEFVEEVPTKSGYFQVDQNNNIVNLVFTEENEIVYICSTNKETCLSFIQAVLKDLFSKYQEIFFEADDTDWAATMLLDQFVVDRTASFNTYLLN